MTLPKTLEGRRADLALGVEYALAEKRFDLWLPYMRILDPPPGGGIVPFQPWPHLMELAQAFRQHRLIVIVKSKQVGVSWLVGGYAVHTAAYHEGAQVSLFSKGQLEASDLLGKSQFIHDHLPADLRGTLAPLKSEMVFPKKHSRILPLPSTEDAGVGLTSTLVGMDEADYHDYFAENYDIAAKPTADAGGQVIIVSTVNPMRLNSAFQRLVKKAGDGEPGENGFVRFFLPYTVRPGRDEAWYRAGLAAADDPWVFTKNYPRTLEEALAPSKRLAYLDQDALVAMLDDCREPVEQRQGGLVRVWRKPVVAGKYVAFGDCAWGEKGSYSCLGIADFQTGEQVAEVYGRPTLDEAALANVTLCKEYNRAYVGIEENGEGRKVVEKMRELGYGERMFCRTPEHPEAKSRSWLTGSGTRPIMLADLEEAVRLRLIVPRCREAVQEMMQFIRTEAGRPQAAEGAYADHVMMWAGLWQMRKHANFGGRASGEVVSLPRLA